MNLKTILVLSMLYLIVSGQMAQVRLDRVGTTLEGLRERNKLIKMSNRVQETGGNLWESVDSIMESLPPDAQKDLGNKVKQVKEKITDLKDDAKGKVKQSASKGKSLTEKLEASVHDTWDALTDYSSEIADWITEKFTHSEKKHDEPSLKEKAVKAAANLKDSASEKLGEATDFIKEHIPNPLGGDTGDLKKGAGRPGTDIAEKIPFIFNYRTKNPETGEIWLDKEEAKKYAHKETIPPIGNQIPESVIRQTDEDLGHHAGPDFFNAEQRQAGDKLKQKTAGRLATGSSLTEKIPNAFNYRTKNPETGEIFLDEEEARKYAQRDIIPPLGNQIPDFVARQFDEDIKHQAEHEIYTGDIPEPREKGKNPFGEQGEAEKKIPTTLGQVGAKLKKKSAKMSDSFSQAGESIKQKAGEAADFIKENMPDSLQGAKQKLKETAEDVADFVQEKLPHSFSEVTEELKERVGKIPDSLANAGMRVKKQAGDAADALKDTFTSKNLKDIGQKVGDKASNLASEVKGAGEKLIKKAHKAAKSAGNIFSDATESLGEAGVYIKENLVDSAEWVEEHTPESLKTAKEKVKTAGRSVLDSAKEAATAASGKLSEASDYIKEKIPKSFDEAGDIVKEKYEQAADSLKEAKEKIQERAADAAKVIKDVVPESLDDAKEKLHDAAEFVKEKVPEEIHVFGAQMRDNVLHAAEWVKEHTPESLEDAKKRIDAAATYVKEHTPKPILMAGEKIAESAVHTAEWVKEKAPETLTVAKEAIGAATEFVKGHTPTPVKQAGEKIKEEVEVISGWVKDHTPGVVLDAGSAIKTQAGQAAEWIKEHTPGSLKEAKDKLANAATYITESTPEPVVQAGKLIKDQAVHAADWVKEHTPESLEDAKKRLETATSYVKGHTPETILDAARWVKKNTPESLEDAKHKLSDAAEFIRQSTPEPVISAGEAIQETVLNAADWIKEITPDSLEDAKEKLSMAADFIRRPTDDLNYNNYPNTYEKKHEEAASTIKRRGRGTTEESEDIYKVRFSQTGEQLKGVQGKVKEAAEKVAEPKKSWSDRSKAAMKDMKEATEETLADAAAYVEEAGEWVKGHTPKILKDYGEKMKEEVETVWEKAKEKVHGGQVKKEDSKSQENKLKDGEPDIAEDDEERKYYKVTSDAKDFDPKKMVKKTIQPNDLLE